MDALETILAEIQDIKQRQDATYSELLARLDAIDRQQDIPLTPKQAAIYLGVTTQTLRNYRRDGLIKPKVRNGLAGYLRIDLEELKRTRK